MDRYDMLPHIVEHSYRVCQLASFLAVELNRKGGNLAPELVVAGSLLHDITKTRSLVTRERHAESGKELLQGLGYPEVAEIVGAHVSFEPGDASRPISSKDVVNYADKRVMHVKVVSLENRFVDLVARYGKTPEAKQRLERMKQGVFQLEERIFAGLDFPPSRLEAFNALSAFDLESIPSELPCPREAQAGSGSP
jgi:putative nucleotidyltransferase with HDIG domain